MATVATADGTQLFYQDWGVGKPIVLIHGWPVNADMWEYQARNLAENGFRVIAYDRRGFGRSDQPWSGYNYNTLADDLAALLEKLDLHAATLVGFSMGGGEIARYLARHGAARVAKVVLVSSVLPFLMQTGDNPDGVDPKIFEGMIKGLKADRPTFLSIFGKQFYGAGLLNFAVTSDQMQWTGGLALQASPKATIDCVTAFAATDFRGDLAAFTMPTLIIHGSSDHTVPAAASSERVAKALPHADYIVYEGAPHALYFTEQDRLCADLMAFAG